MTFYGTKAARVTFENVQMQTQDVSTRPHLLVTFQFYCGHGMKCRCSYFLCLASIFPLAALCSWAQKNNRPKSLLRILQLFSWIENKINAVVKRNAIYKSIYVCMRVKCLRNYVTD